MRGSFRTTFLALCLILFFFSSARSQLIYKHRKPKRPSSVKIPRNKAKVVCPIFIENKYPYHGIGIKLGDPFAITYKLYPIKQLGIDISFGSAASGLYSTYYRDVFQDLSMTDTLGVNDRIGLLSQDVRRDFVFEGKILYHIDAANFVQGLQVYVGGGWELKSYAVNYELILRSGLEDSFEDFSISRVAMGPQTVLGLEYAYFELPISAFLEVEVFYDVVEDPGWERFQGGIGLRYVF
ncbi:MAG: hypothetical protein AAFX87_19855 [Bacteroidota bacterium]